MSARGWSRGGLVPSRAHAPGRRRNLNSAFYRSSTDPVFKRSKFTQAAIDVVAVFGIGAFILITAAAYLGALTILVCGSCR